MYVSAKAREKTAALAEKEGLVFSGQGQGRLPLKSGFRKPHILLI
jgi:hypothetical protein